MEVTRHSTESLPPPARARHWSEVIAETYFPLQLTFADPAAFEGKLERRAFGNVSLSRLATEPMVYERRPTHIKSTVEEEYLVTIPRAAPVEFRQLGREVRCDPGGFIIERGDEPYRFAYGAANSLCVLKVAKATLSERLRSPDRFCAQVFDGTEGLGSLFTSMVLNVNAVTAPNDASARVLGRQMIELLALALDQRSDAAGEAKSAVRAAHLQRVERLIAANLTNPDLDPDMIAAACGISKRYLHELFTDVNKTVSQHIRDERLLAARQCLDLPGCGAIADVAYRFGFADQAQFSRLFKRMFEVSPSGYRAGVSGGS